jgi:hypothetical protein
MEMRTAYGFPSRHQPAINAGRDANLVEIMMKKDPGDH